jgi:hypothetical protein
MPPIIISHNSLVDLANLKKNYLKHSYNHVYMIHNNNGIDYLVEINDKNNIATIYKVNYEHFWNSGQKEFKYDKFLNLRYSQIHESKDRTKGLDNNSIILQDGNKYVFIGSSIYSFNLPKGQTIKEYYSDILNAGVPYPYVITEDYTIFLLEHSYIPNDSIVIQETGINLYGYFYFSYKGPKNPLRHFTWHKS